jgi:hypothetical protein
VPANASNKEKFLTKHLSHTPPPKGHKFSQKFPHLLHLEAIGIFSTAVLLGQQSALLDL